jgi:hypothetical protein
MLLKQQVGQGALKGHGFQPCRKYAKESRLQPLRDIEGSKAEIIQHRAGWWNAEC